MTEPRAGSEVEVPAGFMQVRLEAEERRCIIVLLLLDLAAAILAFWPGVFHMAPGPAFPASAAPVEGVVDGNVVLVGYNLRNFLCGLRLARLCGVTWLFATWLTATCPWL